MKKEISYFDPSFAGKEALTEPEIESVESAGDFGNVSEEDRAVADAVQQRLDVEETAVTFDVEHVERRRSLSAQVPPQRRFLLQTSQDVLLHVAHHTSSTHLVQRHLLEAGEQTSQRFVAPF